MRRAPPVTNAAGGMLGVAKAPVTATSGADTALAAAALGARADPGAHRFARRHAGPPEGRSAARPVAAGAFGKAEIGLFKPADLVAQPRRFLEFEIGGGGPHALVEVGDDRLQILALVMRRIALAQPDQHVIALVYAIEDVGD